MQRQACTLFEHTRQLGRTEAVRTDGRLLMQEVKAYGNWLF